MNTLLDAGDLAARWGVTRPTALAYTRRASFPAPVALSSRTLRWDACEVAAWEAERKAEPVRRVTRRMRARTAQITKPIVRAKRKAA